MVFSDRRATRPLAPLAIERWCAAVVWIVVGLPVAFAVANDEPSVEVVDGGFCAAVPGFLLWMLRRQRRGSIAAAPPVPARVRIDSLGGRSRSAPCLPRSWSWYSPPGALVQDPGYQFSLPWWGPCSPGTRSRSSSGRSERAAAPTASALSLRAESLSSTPANPLTAAPEVRCGISVAISATQMPHPGEAPVRATPSMLPFVSPPGPPEPCGRTGRC